MVSMNFAGVILGFSARHVIDLPSSSVVGTKLSTDLVVFVRISSCKIKTFILKLLFSNPNHKYVFYVYAVVNKTNTAKKNIES